MKNQTVLLALVTLLAAGTAHAAVGEWGAGAKAQARIVAASFGADGKIDAGIEITMPPNWHTYWRNPGDAGVAPVFDLSASTNLGATSLLFPVPQRLDDGFAVTNIYADHVIFPLDAVALDPAQPVQIAISMQIGVCEEVCVPDELEARVTIAPGEKDSTAMVELAKARKALPLPPAPGVFSFDSVTREGGTDKRPVFRITGVVPDAANATIFIEGPQDWAPYTPEVVTGADGKSAWTVKFSRLGAKVPIEGSTFRITAVSGGKAIEQTLPLQ